GEGYNFAVVSGHNHIRNGGKKIEIDDQVDEYFLEKYLSSFGDEWVEQDASGDITTVNLKSYAEYSDKVGTSDFLVLRAEEIDYRDSNNPDNNGDRLIHVTAVNVRELIEPSTGG